MMFTKDEIYREYDQLIGLTMQEIIKASKDEGVIRLLNFNPLNKGHIYLLRIALFVRDI